MKTLDTTFKPLQASFPPRPMLATPTVEPDTLPTRKPSKPMPEHPREEPPLTPASPNQPAPLPPCVRPEEGEEVETC